MTTLQKIQLAIAIVTLLKKEDLKVWDIVETVLPYIGSDIESEEIQAISQLIELLAAK